MRMLYDDDFRFDFEKLKAGIQEVCHLLQERLQQWSEYEDGFDRLLSWLTEAEGTLKGYAPRNSLEEKEEQLDKYQVNLVYAFISSNIFTAFAS